MSTLSWTTQQMANVPKGNHWLTRREVAVLGPMTIVKRRAEWRLGRWTAKLALLARFREVGWTCEPKDIEICAASDGAPEAFIAGRPAPFAISLSHSHGLAMCAACERETAIGCDVEFVEDRSEAFIDSYFTPSERERIRWLPQQQRALQATLLWSARESALKAVREGLRRDPLDVAVDISFEQSGARWNTFTASCNRSERAFQGWWRATGTHVFTLLHQIASPLPLEETRCINIRSYSMNAA